MEANSAHKGKCCHKCHKTEHLAWVCKSNKRSVWNRSRNANVLEADRESSESSDEIDE